jgi:hypothetical protein
MSTLAPSGLRGAAARGRERVRGRRPEAPHGARGQAGDARSRWAARARVAAIIALGAVALRLLLGVGFPNYDTLYALVWGQQLARGEAPQYAIPIAPTPHPLMEAVGFLAAPLGAAGASDVSVWIAYVALAACGYLVYRLGSAWFNRPVGALAALILLTRTPILSYGSRAYIDLPFLALMLGALLVETRRPRAGAPVLALLALAGLLRPEAWAFSAIYWLYLAAAGRIAYDRGTRRVRRVDGAAGRVAREGGAGTARSTRELAGLALLSCSAPALWLLSDALVTGNPLWSLTHTKRTASTLDRVTGVRNVPQYIPRRVGEIMRPAELVAAALGGVLALAWLRPRARTGAIVGAVAVLVFAVLASLGLPIDTRYAFLASAILCIFAGVGVFGWMLLAREDRHRRGWAIAGGLLLVALVASIPGEYGRVHTQFRNLARQQHAQDALATLASRGALPTACGPIGVPNHAPIPLLALWLHVKPGGVVSEQVRTISRGTYVEAANAQVRHDYILDPHEPRPLAASIPPGFVRTRRNRSWIVYERCA